MAYLRGVRMDLLVDFDAFWRSLSADVARARARVYTQTFSFEGDATGLALADALLQTAAPDRRVLVDSFTRFVLSDKLLYAPANWFNRELRAEQRATREMTTRLQAGGTQLRFTNPPGLSPRRWLARNHKKLIVIDDSVVYLGGINFSDHNAAWHDLMLRVEDEGVAEFFRADFEATWEGRNRLASASFPELEIHTVDGRENPSKFARALELIAAAQTEIYVASPYVTFPFYEALGAAQGRGVTVRIVTPEANNWRIFSDYARWEAGRAGLDLRFYQPGMSHLKAMLIDNRQLILGSSNFDYLSYRLHQEIIAVITAPALIEQFRLQALEPDLARSLPAGDLPPHVSKRRLEWKIKSLTAGLRWLCGKESA
jgi:cardiolipin synthase